MMIPGILAQRPSAAAVDPYWPSVTALLHFDGVNGTSATVDSSGKSVVSLNAGAVLSSANSRFGPTSLRGNGSGGYGLLSGSGLAFGTGDFTLELFASRSGWADHPTGEIFLVDARLGGTNQMLLDINSSSAKLLRWYVGGSTRIQATDVIGPEWKHVAVCRSGTVTTMYVDGASVGQWVADTTNYTSSQWTVGGRFAPFEGSRLSWDGFIDEMRVTKGVARYTSNFTPPAAPFPGD